VLRLRAGFAALARATLSMTTAARRFAQDFPFHLSGVLQLLGHNERLPGGFP
jgi:hypothetical protein